MASNVIEKIRDAGIVGAGGAGFPSHVKLNVDAEVVVVNGAECEPLIRVDQQLMAMQTVVWKLPLPRPAPRKGSSPSKGNISKLWRCCRKPLPIKIIYQYLF